MPTVYTWTGQTNCPDFNSSYGFWTSSSYDSTSLKYLQFHELPGDDANRHIDKFLEVTQHIKQNGVSDDALRLSLFPYSLTYHATAWYDRLLRNSIHTFDDMMRKFLSKYFPPSMVTKLRNEITKFRQDLNESLFKAWEHYKLSIDRYPNHNMLLVTQIDTFYNGLTLRGHHQCCSRRNSYAKDIGRINISSTESPEVVRKLKMINKNFLDIIRQMQSVKSVDPKCETCGGPHSYTKCPAVGGYTQEAAYATTGNHNSGGNSYQLQGDRNMLSYRSNNYLGPPSFPPQNVQNNQNYNQSQGNYQAPNNQGRGQNFSQGNNNYQVPNYQAQVGPSNELSNYMKINETNMRAMQTQMTNMKTKLRNEFKSTIDTRINKIENQNNQIMNILTNLKMERQSPSGSGSLPSNTIANPRGDLKAITTRSVVTYDGPMISPTPSSLLKVVKRETKATKDKPIVALKPNSKPLIPYPSRLNDQKLREKTNSQMLKFLQIFQRLHFDLIFSDALLHIPKFVSDRSLL
nr:hypothetical protein [Tanacetum cinerariifolium]